MKIETFKMEGPVLDWAVAKCEGYSQCIVFGRGAVRAEGLLRSHRLGGVDPMLLRPVHDEWVKKCEGYPWSREQTIWEPSIDWAQGGPIIEREQINLEIRESDTRARFHRMRTNYDGKAKSYGHAYGDTPLIAAMRCYVQWKLGSEIEVPDELVE